MWVEPIIDRTQADVDLIKLDPLNNTTKGAYNYTDLNRIETNCEYVMNARNNRPELFSPISIVTKTDWKVTDIPSIEDFNRIRDNINTLIYDISKESGWEEIEYSNTMNYIKANILEKDLALIKRIIERCQKELRKCGSFYCGTQGLGLFAKPIEFIKIDIYSGTIRCGEEFKL